MINDNLQKNFDKFREHIFAEPDIDERFSKMTMIIRSLSLNQYILEKLYQKSIKDVLKNLMSVVNDLILECFTNNYKNDVMTFSNLIKALCFDIHPVQL